MKMEKRTQQNRNSFDSTLADEYMHDFISLS